MEQMFHFTLGCFTLCALACDGLCDVKFDL